MGKKKGRNKEEPEEVVVMDLASTKKKKFKFFGEKLDVVLYVDECLSQDNDGSYVYLKQPCVPDFVLQATVWLSSTGVISRENLFKRGEKTSRALLNMTRVLERGHKLAFEKIPLKEAGAVFVLLHRFLSELDPPLLPEEVCDGWMGFSHKRKRKHLKRVLSSLPMTSLALLRHIIHFLGDLNGKEALNGCSVAVIGKEWGNAIVESGGKKDKRDEERAEIVSFLVQERHDLLKRDDGEKKALDETYRTFAGDTDTSEESSEPESEEDRESGGEDRPEKPTKKRVYQSMGPERGGGEQTGEEGKQRFASAPPVEIPKDGKEWFDMSTAAELEQTRHVLDQRTGDLKSIHEENVMLGKERRKLRDDLVHERQIVEELQTKLEEEKARTADVARERQALEEDLEEAYRVSGDLQEMLHTTTAALNANVQRQREQQKDVSQMKMQLQALQAEKTRIVAESEKLRRANDQLMKAHEEQRQHIQASEAQAAQLRRMLEELQQERQEKYSKQAGEDAKARATLKEELRQTTVALQEQKFEFTKRIAQLERELNETRMQQREERRGRSTTDELSISLGTASALYGSRRPPSQGGLLRSSDLGSRPA